MKKEKNTKATRSRHQAFLKSVEMNSNKDDDGEIDIRISRKNASNEQIIIV